jgi:hypothetical protein
MGLKKGKIQESETEKMIQHSLLSFRLSSVIPSGARNLFGGGIPRCARNDKVRFG